MDKYTKLLKNSGIFAIANIGSHLIALFLVRFYTELLTRQEYGMIDVMVTTTSIVMPIISLSIVEAVLRFSIDEDKPNVIFVNGLFVAICGSVVFGIIAPCFFCHTAYSDYFIYMLMLVFFTSIAEICRQHVRGIGKTSVFALSGVVRTTVLAGCNIIFLLWAGWKIEGYMLSMIISEMTSIVFLLFASKLYKDIQLCLNMRLLRQMIRYSIPLVPNSLSWWVMNAADKYTILLMLGASSNGLYAVAHKLPSLVHVCNNLFFQAWQLSAVEESQSKGRTEFYSNVFNVLSFVLFMVTAVLFMFLRPIMNVLTAAEFGNAWKYSPFLIIGMVFAAFSSFLGTNYVAIKKTKGAFKTSVVGALVNIVFNFVFIKLIGMNGAALATMISFAVTWVYRTIDTRAFVHVKYKFIPLVVSIAFLVVQAFFLITSFPFSAYTGAFVCISIMFLYREEFFLVVNIGKKCLRHGR